MTIRQGNASVWDAIEDIPVEAESMKLRAALTMRTQPAGSVSRNRACRT